MVIEHIASKQAIYKQESYKQNPARQRKAYLLQLMGEAGSGARRLALHLIQPARRVLWISRAWNLYAPTLWQIAASHQIQLFGLECKDRRKWRFLWKEIFTSQAFDGWILDSLQLNSGDAAFLEQLTRHHPFRLIAIESRTQSLFSHRAQLSLSHHSYRLEWKKGGPLTPQYYPSPFLEFFKNTYSSSQSNLEIGPKVELHSHEI